ncbi:FKBP-type peptidyl-prolyl cis-trans isomerase [Desulfosudis oleivorans]|uniref:Peptidyl-prolyl cis-trans isomerase n=1 Tax=Desulfosudis oleivorans (strain DSM 6200 / JCM 39069 / Hxd3) TaxID=96561 RepID=A8ZSS1_DESOH|nr:peptidylprolyl isomerase [Desulfosudis oleivorans]ABW65984.1 peptidylprolyl isomerase FKBP-type [Desulfosudis oleivorans Hxd3]
MTTVKNGLFVSVKYKGTLGNGEVFDSSEGRPPLEVQVGAGQVFEGFEAALMGMSLNEKKTFTLEPEEACGQRNEDYTQTFSRDEVPPDETPEEGQVIILSSPEGQEIPARIVEVTDEKVVVDLNHPLAGETLTFEVEVVGISETATQSFAGGCGCDDDGCGCDDGGGCGCDGGGCSSDLG